MNVYGGDCTMQFACHSYVTEKKTLAHQDQYMFLGNCPPTPPLSQHFALSEK